MIYTNEDRKGGILTWKSLYLMATVLSLLTILLSRVVFCHVYITEHSYVSVKAKVSSTAQEILKVVAEKIQHAEEDLALVAVTFSGGKLFSVLEY